MLKENIENLINAIAGGDTIEIENNFNTVMAHKIADKLESMRADVAQGMFTGSRVVEESVEELDEAACEHTKGTKKLDRFEGDRGASAEVRHNPNDDELPYEVHPYKDNQHLGSKNITSFSNKKDAIDQAKLEVGM
jgi:hypothetical protein